MFKNKGFYSKHLRSIYHMQNAALFISSLRQTLRKNKGVLEEQHALRSLTLHHFKQTTIFVLPPVYLPISHLISRLLLNKTKPGSVSSFLSIS